ncbi:MAG: hypothetical protein AABX19_01770 [Nanoarchaeota archaeon]
MAATIIQLVGTSNSGKGVTQKVLAHRLRADKYQVVEVTEPGPLRSLAKAYRLRQDKDPWVETAVFSTDRLMTYQDVVIPRLNEDGLVFLSDRGLPDTIVYQGMMGGVDIDKIIKMNSNIPQADLYLVLIVDGQIGYARALKKLSETGEQPSKNETPGAIDRLAGYYKKLGMHLEGNIQIIDTTNLTIDEVVERSYQETRKVL